MNSHAFKRIVLLGAALLVFAWCGAGLAGEAFRFAVLSDCRGGIDPKGLCDKSGLSPVLGVMVQSMMERHKATPFSLVVFPGDLMSGIYARDKGSVAECNRAMLGLWRDAMGPLLKAGISVRVTLGNHEAVAYVDPAHEYVKCSKHNRPYAASSENFQMLREALGDLAKGEQGPANDQGFTYSFDAGGCHFVMLNAYTMFEYNSFSNETIAWLENDLAKAEQEGKKLFVASHPPAFPGSGHIWDSLPFFDPSYRCDGYDVRYGIDHRRERDRFWNILKKHKVIAHFCGHEHNIQVQQVEGVWQVVSGGVTKDLYPLNGTPKAKKPNDLLYDGQPQNPRASVIWPWNGPEDAPSYWGWCLVTVDGDKVTLDVLGSGGDSPPKSPDQIRLLKTFTLRQ